MRLFVAVDLPSELKRQLEATVASLSSRLPRARWVRPELLHLTLAFLGDVDSGSVGTIEHGLREKLGEECAFPVHLDRVGTFPPDGRVRIVWIGLQPEADLARLAAGAREGLQAVGAKFDAKPFRAHVTLARCDPPWPSRTREDLTSFVTPFTEPFSFSSSSSSSSLPPPPAAAASSGAPTSFVCARVTLFSSELGKGGPTYHPEAEIALRAVAA